MRTRRRNRSSCDSGSGNVPAKSCGFCVAMTKNGSGSGMVCPSSETWPSFIASSSADWVRGLARLISSARSMFAKIGPWRRTNSPVPLVVDAHAEDVARQEVARELDAAQLAADRLGEGAREGGLADARDVLDEQVAAGEERDERELHGVLLALQRTFDGLTQRLERGQLLGDAGSGSRHGCQSSTANDGGSARASTHFRMQQRATRNIYTSRKRRGSARELPLGARPSIMPASARVPACRRASPCHQDVRAGAGSRRRVVQLRAAAK